MGGYKFTPARAAALAAARERAAAKREKEGSGPQSQGAALRWKQRKAAPAASGGGRRVRGRRLDPPPAPAGETPPADTKPSTGAGLPSDAPRGRSGRPTPLSDLRSALRRVRPPKSTG